MSKIKHSISKTRETVTASDLPSRCRTWDARRLSRLHGPGMTTDHTRREGRGGDEGER